MSAVSILVGDCLASLRAMADQSVNTCVTSPPYFGLRDYGHAGQIGLEQTPDEFVAKLVEVFRGVRRVLRDDGTLWLNLGDSYGSAGGNTHAGFNARYHGTQSVEDKQGQALDGVTERTVYTGLGAKNLLGIPWRVAFALQADGWTLRQDIIWHKPNPMPESVKDRCTKAHEYIFLLSPKCAASSMAKRTRWRVEKRSGRSGTLATAAACGPWQPSPSRALTSPRSRRT